MQWKKRAQLMLTCASCGLHVMENAEIKAWNSCSSAHASCVRHKAEARDLQSTLICLGRCAVHAACRETHSLMNGLVQHAAAHVKRTPAQLHQCCELFATLLLHQTDARLFKRLPLNMHPHTASPKSHCCTQKSSFLVCIHTSFLPSMRHTMMKRA